MIHTFKIYDREDLEEQDPWSGILAAIMFGVRATYHTTLEATPTQLVLVEMQFYQYNIKQIGNTFKIRNKNSLS